MSESRLITIDLDSTLADTTHRQWMINRDGGETDWDAYSWECSNDTPVEGVAALVRLLAEQGHEVHALSGRKHIAHHRTSEWLLKHGIPVVSVWLDESKQGKYEYPMQHAEYKLSRARDIERETSKKIALHLDDWALVTSHFSENGIPAICVRTPVEIQELVEASQATAG